MKLIDVKLVRTRLALPDDDGVNAAVKSALDGTTAMFEARLMTSFDKATKTDIFLTYGREFMAQDGYFRLRLSAGFVLSSPDVTVCWAETPQELATAETIALTDCLVDYERGFVLVPYSESNHPESSARRNRSYLNSRSYNGYMKVVYQYGFQTLAEVPAWLKEAALAYTIKVLSMQQVSDKKDEKATTIFGFISSHGEEILDRHLRNHYMAIQPIA